MKPIPSAYWRQNYGEQSTPSLLQQWWVQRWLELTDPDTSYLYGIPLTNTAQLLRDLARWQPRIGNTFQGRTLHFLLLELRTQLNVEPGLADYVDAPVWHMLCTQTTCLMEALQAYFDGTGSLHNRVHQKSAMKPVITAFDTLRPILSEILARLAACRREQAMAHYNAVRLVRSGPFA